jgi:TctA family transporter
MSWVAVEYFVMRLTLERSWQEAMRWLATASIMTSALVISFSIPLSTQVLPFSGFLLGHVLWVLVGVIQRDKPIIALNAFFIPIDLFAMYIRL